MDAEKLKILMGLNRQKTPEQRRLEAAAVKMGEEADAVRKMMKSKGWVVLDEFFEAKQKVLFHEFKTCKKKDFARLQLKSQIIDEFKSFLNSKVLRDPDI